MDSFALIERMLCAPLENRGSALIIISLENKSLIPFWKERLEKKRGTLFSKSTTVCFVHEDWKGGAGNFLGTLYAFKEAEKQLKQDLLTILERGDSISLFHTAGKGKRLYPIAGAHQGNKSALVLPNDTTLLEAVISQHTLFDEVRAGRFSVYWSDQIIIPEKIPDRREDAPFDLLGIKIKAPSQKEYEEKGYQNYGLVIDGCQYEKIPFETFEKVQKGGFLHQSLGSFSLSRELLKTLLSVYDVELQEKKESLDSDPDFLMPATLDEAFFFMLHPNYPKKRQKQAKKVKEQFSGNFIDVLDLGESSYFWDFGSVKNLYKNLMKIASKGSEGECMRKFFRIKGLDQNESYLENVSSQHIDCKRSVLINCKAESIQAKDSLVIETEAKTIKAEGALAYHTKAETIALQNSQVQATIQGEPYFTTLQRDGKKDFSTLLPGNKRSYENSLKP